MQAIVLAAGEGQRLRPFTATKPKVMIKVANKPILEYVIDALKQAGIFDIVLVVGYKKERIMNYFKDGGKFGVKIRYAFQEQQLGTAHALKQAEEFVDDEFVVVSGDNIVDDKTIKLANKPFTILYKIVKEVSKYGALVVRDGVVEKIVEKPKDEISNLANTGIYCFDKSVFKEIGNETSLSNVINNMIEKGYEFRCVEGSKWLDIVYPWDILRVNDLAMEFYGKKIGGKIEQNATIIGDVIIGKNTIIKSNTYIRGPVIIGENCKIGPNSVIMPYTSIGDNTTVSPLTLISNCVIGDNVRIGSNSNIENSVIDSGTIISSNCSAVSDETEVKVGEEWHKINTGVFIGEGCILASNVTAKPGCIIGNFVEVKPLKLLDGIIPDNTKVL
ncbi:nucleotidyl transferase [Archaeoglobales archaeon]|nr:MAG: nucleotidyl transferase [Archaeoglobales archaeon]